MNTLYEDVKKIEQDLLDINNNKKRLILDKVSSCDHQKGIYDLNFYRIEVDLPNGYVGKWVMCKDCGLSIECERDMDGVKKKSSFLYLSGFQFVPYTFWKTHRVALKTICGQMLYRSGVLYDSMKKLYQGQQEFEV
jgi:hypothetical protein